MSTVELRHVRKRYGGAEIIHGIDLAIADGEFLALVGPSGCGKSTLLRMIAGLERITDGEILIDGRVINGLSPKDRNIAMVFQNYALYPHMTTRENIGLNLKLAGVAKAEVAKRVDEAVRLLDIDDLLDRRPAQLSGGQRQRVAMGRAIVRNPSVFLFDEPLSNLDAKLRVQMRSEIKALHNKIRTTAIYVTHDQIEAMTLADRVVVLNNGFVEQQGDPISLYQRPDNLFVAGFIGSPSMNFLTATIERRDGRAIAHFPDGNELAVEAAASLDNGHRVTVGVRPEHIELNAGGGLPARVVNVEPTGAQTFVQLESAGGAIMAVVEGERRFSINDRLAVTVSRSHLFDQESGKRL
jgi:multiple sugar transport system ATP-binding protein